MVCIEEIVGDDLEVVVGSVRKGTAAVAVAQSPDARHIGLQLIVNRDVSALIGDNPRLIETQVACVGDAPHREKNARSEYLRRTFLTIHTDGDTSLMIS